MPKCENRLKTELARKGIHLTTGLVPLGYAWFDSKALIVTVLAVFSAGLIVLEIARRRDNRLSRLFSRWFGYMLRAHESERLLGSTHYCLASLLVVALFPKTVAVLALLYLAAGDTAASLVGMRWGRIRIGRKSLEGTLAFWAAASLVAVSASLISREYPLVAGLVAAPCAALAELLLPKLDDNWVIPAVSAVVMTGVLVITGGL